MRINYTILSAPENFTDNNGFNTKTEMNVLKVTHNAGFFSNLTVKLIEIVIYFNDKRFLPDVVDGSEQFIHYKSRAGDNMVEYYFENNPMPIEYEKQIPLWYDCMAIQFDSYKNLPFEQIKPFVEKYFTPSENVQNCTRFFEERYNLDYNNLCSVFYRGNDKNREMEVSPYSIFINKAKEIKAKNPDIKFLVQPDETEFLEAFLAEFPDSIYFEETPHMRKKDSAMFFELPIEHRGEYGAKFFAAVLCLSKCKHVITHSGNGALWLSLYRGNADNVNQVFNNNWI